MADASPHPAYLELDLPERFQFQFYKNDRWWDEAVCLASHFTRNEDGSYVGNAGGSPIWFRCIERHPGHFIHIDGGGDRFTYRLLGLNAFPGDDEMLDPKDDAGDSSEQRDVEPVMVESLAKRLGVHLAPRKISLPNGGRLEIDAASDDLSVLCEAWAHHGPPKPGQRKKVLADAFKLAFAARISGGSPRLILLFSDEAAASPFRGSTWAAAALESSGIEIVVERLTDEARTRVAAAQQRQSR